MIDLDAMQGSMHTEVKTLHDVGKSLDEIKSVLKGAALLSRNGSLDVQAVTESFEAHKHRLALEEHTRLRASLESLQGWREKRPEIISDLEDRIARLQAKHPFLIKGTGDVPLTSRWAIRRRRLAMRLRALLPG